MSFFNGFDSSGLVCRTHFPELINILKSNSKSTFGSDDFFSAIIFEAIACCLGLTVPLTRSPMMLPTLLFSSLGEPGLLGRELSSSIVSHLVEFLLDYMNTT